MQLAFKNVMCKVKSNINCRMAKTEIFVHFIPYHHHHHVLCLTTGLEVFPNWALHRVLSSASSLQLQYLLLSLRLSSAF